jgi:FkbM family methyltransferase
MPFVEGTELIVARGMVGATGNLYAGLHEFNDMGFLLHFLRPGDRFLDVGANVGSYSVLAAGVCGAACTAIEPIPTTHAALLANVRINALEQRVVALNVGVGPSQGTLRFTRSLDCLNHVVPTDEEGTGDVLEVPVTTIDAITRTMRPALIKIDVEGFEMQALAGADETLAAPEVEAIIIELNGLGSRYGSDDDHIDEKLRNFGFAKYRYDPFARRLRPRSRLGGDNVLYLRRPAEASERLRRARAVQVHGQSV